MGQAGAARIRWAIVCAMCLIRSSPAQELSEQEFLTEFPTVLSASRLRQDATETPQAITVIDQAMIKASGAREFAELFRMVPGFTVSYVTYVKGLQPIVNYHGLGREFFSRLQVLIDGRSVNNATLGGVDWSEFPLAMEDIDRIEVIRGPSNASHGIGAFMATINFVTKHASQERGLGAAVNVGNGGILDAVGRFGSNVGSIDYRVTAGHRADDGFSGLPDRRQRDFLSARADWQWGQTDSLMVQAGATTGTDGVTSLGPTDPQRSVRIDTSYTQLKWERSLDADNGFHVQIYHYDFKLSDRFVAEALSANTGQFTLDGGAVVRRTDLEFQQNVSAGTDLRGVWGASAREDLTDVPLLFTQLPTLRIQRIFAHVEWRPVNALLVNAGAMIEHNNLTGTDIAPQLAANFRFAPNQTVRLSVSRALRTPSPIESQSEFGVGPPGSPRFGPSGHLRPETIVSRELGYVGEWPAWNATVDVKVFYDTIHDLIDLVGAPNTAPAAVYPRSAINGDDAKQRGIEGEFIWRPSPETRLVATASHIETSSGDHFDTYTTSNPRNTLHALVAQHFADTWDASVAVHAQSRLRASGFSEAQRGFGRVDLRLAHRVPLAHGDGELALSIENVFDNRYTEYRHDDVARRRAWLSLKFGL